MRKLNRKTCLMIGLLALVIAEPSFAGTGGDEFSDVWTTIKDWTQGTLGRVVAGSMILVGIISGVARQSLMAFAIGIGGGIGLYNAPTIIESILTATVPEGGAAILPAVEALASAA
ncbi:MAG: TraA family conjugative transfer protein [Succinivibrionaceae bacterium]|nr:TraA family conjugative transfer protein [Pseudomonadota bacterium]MDY6275158.1 TraA family conjugative transfer protein [Succinivibrionaceae bacterium]MDY6336199.1 TraA family conjugative transfer protein [Succinivibrionaceae bacterium]MDY6376346.1 TraA family conjugative transfer protein [Succinivibrionaceae bacterium]